MEEVMTSSDVVDLYEEMLYERAAKGIRPTLYVSSATDFECSLVMLLDDAWNRKDGSPEQRPPAIEFANRAMTN
jgi:hypothetical protein